MVELRPMRVGDVALIERFYERCAFETAGERDFDGDRCLVMRLDRVPTSR